MRGQTARGEDLAPILPGVENRTIVVNDNLPALRALPDACVDLIYLDPPFNSGRAYLNPIGLAEEEELGLLGRRHGDSGAKGRGKFLRKAGE